MNPKCRIPRLLTACVLALAVSLSAPGQTGPPAVVPPADAATGPTIRLDVGHDSSLGNPVAAFMYFVPLISPEPVFSSTSPGSTQSARVLSAKRKNTPHSFVVSCEFEFTGDGSQQSIFDLEPNIHRHERQLKAGGLLKQQLSAITIKGPGSGTVEVEGSINNNVETVSAVRLRFNSRGKASPVAIELCELRYAGGECRRLNEMVARVNTLSFHEQPGPPQMEVTVASVKRKGAGHGLWQNVKGSIKGLAVNLLIDPLTVETVGHRAMLDFGRSLASGAATYTFPQASNVTLSTSPAQRQ